MRRTASCCCGSLSVEANAEPAKISLCHCKSCQRRTGSAFGVAVFFCANAVSISGNSQSFTRLGESGHPVEFHFCSACGSTVYWYPHKRPDRIAVALGCFHDPIRAPDQAVHEQERAAWVSVQPHEN